MQKKMNVKKILLAAAAGAAAMSLVSCAGGAGGGSSESSDTGSGVDFGASKDEYIEALAQMEPTTLHYQLGAVASDGPQAQAEEEFADALEEWSGGKITVERLFGQPIAGYDTVTESAAVGELEIALELPSYTPQKYPVSNELGALGSRLPTDLYYNELVHMATMHEMAWEDEEFLSEWQDKDVDVLIPLQWEFASTLLCTEPLTSLDDFAGAQVRVGSVSDRKMVEALGATPVSMAFTEGYEALQRNTIDCTFGAMKTGHEAGFLDVAPYVIYPQNAAWGRTGVAWIMGSEVAELPLAARQLIFDQSASLLSAHIEYGIDYFGLGTKDVKRNAGDIVEIDSEADTIVESVADELAADAGTTADGTARVERYDEIAKRWADAADGMDYESLDDWSSMMADPPLSETIDPSRFTDEVFEQVYLTHRPTQ